MTGEGCSLRGMLERKKEKGKREEIMVGEDAGMLRTGGPPRCARAVGLGVPPRPV